MSYCINTKSMEFQTLLKQSGLPDFYIKSVCGYFMEKYDRFPYLDEIPKSDSSKYLKETLNIKKNSAKIEKVLSFSNSNSLEEAKIKLNDKYRDVEIDFIPMTNDTIVSIKKRPEVKHIIRNEHESLADSKTVFYRALTHLQNSYGIKFNNITNEDIQNSDLQFVPGVSNASAFVYNGEIYINTDFADKDAPIHEMMHIFVGGLRTSNPDLYFQLTESMTQLPNFQAYAKLYPNRTMSDIGEEVFVSEFAKYVSGIDSSISELPENIQYELLYNAKRVLDSVLMGENSVNGYNSVGIFNSSLKNLCQLTNSNLDTVIKNSSQHHKLANIKSDMLKSNELIEDCNG